MALLSYLRLFVKTGRIVLQIKMFKDLKKYKTILVTGPQRSGTTIAGKMIAHDTGHEYIDEYDYQTIQEKLFLKVLADKQNIVVQCPAMSHIIHKVADENTLVVMMIRNSDDIYASEVRMKWFIGPYVELARLGMDRHTAKRFRMRGGRVSDLKYERWEKKQKKLIPHYLELEYESLSSHPLWIPREKRVNFGGKQTEL